MKQLLFCVTFLAMFVLFYSCKKSIGTGGPGTHDTTTHDTTHPNALNVHVYLSGYLGGAPEPYGADYTPSKAVYWKDSVETILSNDSTSVATSIAVAGNDVYVTGYVEEQTVYWKNGQLNYLPSYGSFTKVTAGSALASGTDIYFIGCVSNFSGSIPCYWKNGKLVLLTDSSKIDGFPEATGIFVDGNDVYICGSESVKATGRKSLELGYWKNGIFTALSIPPIPKGHFIPTGITVLNGTAFICGYDESLEKNQDMWKYRTYYWENGVLYTLGSYNKHSLTQSIVQAGGKIYVAGCDEKEHEIYWSTVGGVALHGMPLSQKPRLYYKCFFTSCNDSIYYASDAINAQHNGYPVYGKFGQNPVKKIPLMEDGLYNHITGMAVTPK